MGITVIPISDLRHRITIQTMSRVKDGQGGFTQSWATLATVWAKIKPISNKERVFAQRLEYQRSHEIIIRYRSDITNEMQITFDSRTFQIKGVRSPDERNAYLIIDVEENQAT